MVFCKDTGLRVRAELSADSARFGGGGGREGFLVKLILFFLRWASSNFCHGPKGNQLRLVNRSFSATINLFYRK